MSGGTEGLMANMVGGTTTGSIGGVQSGVVYFGMVHSLSSVGSSALYKETIGDIRGHFIRSSYLLWLRIGNLHKAVKSTIISRTATDLTIVRDPMNIICA
jgi:hypothetical protein